MVKFYNCINAGTNTNGHFVKHYSEINGRKVWNGGEACQGGLAPSSLECTAFDNFVLANDEKVYLGKL